MNTDEEMFDEVDRKFMRKHWKTMSVFGVIGGAAIVVGLFVLTWFLATAQATGFVPAALGQWSVGIVINFILHLIFWELLLVGSWVAVLGAAIGYRWYKTLTDEEKEGKPKRGKREHSDAFGFFFGLLWLIVVWFDNRWNLAFESWTINDWIYSCLAAFGWGALIIGIPVLLYFVWWVRQDP
ncbi:MAG: hypothetical protein ACW98Y_17795 [Candidatus Thorarchaeota archaeon]|jgi:hypothetical protein